MDHLDDIEEIAKIIENTPGVAIIKVDTRKMIQPREWGWRFVKCFANY